MISASSLNQNIKLWWEQNFPESPLISLVEFTAGQSHPCFLINSKLVLKIYFEGDHFEKSVACLTLLSDSGFTPKILKTSGNNDLNNLLGTHYILMEYISGQNLAAVMANASDLEKYTLGQKVGQMVEKIHNSKIAHNQTFETKILLDLAKKSLKAASQNTHLPSQIAEFAKNFIASYPVRELVQDLVLVHGDIHLENFIQHFDQIYIIDFDLSDFGPRFFESRILLHQAFAPANLVSHELKNGYPLGFMLPFLKGILKIYPQILPKEVLPEIKLIALTEILRHLDFDDHTNDQNTPILRAEYIFDQIFMRDILDAILV